MLLILCNKCKICCTPLKTHSNKNNTSTTTHHFTFLCISRPTQSIMQFCNTLKLHVTEKHLLSSKFTEYLASKYRHTPVPGEFSKDCPSPPNFFFYSQRNCMQSPNHNDVSCHWHVLKRLDHQILGNCSSD